jgi:predicted Na+-dependent transporter
VTNLGIVVIVAVTLLAFIPYAHTCARLFGFELLDAIAVALAVGGICQLFPRGMVGNETADP